MGLPQKISSRQTIGLLITLVMSTGILVIPARALSSVGRGAWLSMLIGASVGVVLSVFYTPLLTLVPDKRFTDRLILILGSKGGKLLSLTFSLLILLNQYVILREGATLVRVNFLSETPVTAVVLGFSFLSFYGAWVGPKAIARVNALYLPFLFLTFLILFSSVIKNDHWSYLWPPYEAGLGPLLSNSFIPLSWVAEISLLLYISSDISDLKQVHYRLPLFASLTLLILLTLITALTQVVLGPPLASHYLFPLLQVGRTLFFSESMRGIDALIMTVWVLGIIIKASLYLYYPVTEVAYCLGLKNERALLVPFSLLMFFLASGSLLSTQELFHYLSEIFPFFALSTFEGLGPLLLLIIWWLRGKPKKGAN